MAANWRSDRPRQEDNGLALNDQCSDRPQCTTQVGSFIVNMWQTIFGMFRIAGLSKR